MKKLLILILLFGVADVAMAQKRGKRNVKKTDLQSQTNPVINQQNDASTDYVQVQEDGKVAIGSNNPDGLLDVWGRGDFASDWDANLFHVRSGLKNTDQIAASYTSKFRITKRRVYTNLDSDKDDLIPSDMDFVVGRSVGIGLRSATSRLPNGYKLVVAGKIMAEEVKVQLQGAWSDFVFDPDYVLPTLQEVEGYINKHGHLPEIPSADEVAQEGISVGDMQAKLLQKIEELTLYVIEQEKKIAALQAVAEGK